MSLTKNQLFNTVEQVKDYVDSKDLSITPHIDETTKHWFIGDNDTGIVAEGVSGNDGITPHIDESTKHWFIGDTDTGIVAEGKDGEGSNINVDSAMSNTSTNPVQNKVIKKYVDDKSTNVSTADGNAVVKKSDGIYVEDLEPKIDQLNIAQKTVNEVGSKSLLSSPVSFTVSKATTSGKAVSTAVNKTIALNDNITNYDYIDIYLKPNTSEAKLPPQLTRIKVDTIVYNNSTTFNKLNNSTFMITFDWNALNDGAYGLLHLVARAWFKNKNTLYIENFYYPVIDTTMITLQIADIVGIKDRTVIVDPVEYVNTNNGIEDTPVGHIIPFMGNNAPAHYLICDGSTYNIADYPYLSQHFKDEFGKVNYFGGNGTTTFTVPDLRGEFLRGTGTNSHANQGSGANVGTHQDGTEDIYLHTYQGKLYVHNGTIEPSNYDSIIGTTGSFRYYNVGSILDETTNNLYTSRPTNTSVLYCIKYEPTYYMKVEGKDVYSTAETMVGYWIDGKPLYQKTINFGSLPNATEKSIAHGVSNVDTIWLYDGFTNNGTIKAPISFANSYSSDVCYVFYIKSNYIICRTGYNYSDYSAYVTIRYTKTTD